MLEAIKKRRSYRDFQERPVEEEKLREILKAAMFAPSAGHQRLWEFIVVKDQKIKDNLAATKTWSYFVNRAPVVIVVCSKEGRHWLEDASIAAENIYLETTNQGLGTCFVQIKNSQREDGSDAEKYIKNLLGVPPKIHVLCLMPIGYPKEVLPEHDDSEFEEVKIHQEKY